MKKAKPAPDIIAVALDKGGVSADHAVLVGDSVWAIKAAATAGVTSIGLLSGGTAEALLREAGAVEVYNDVATLLGSLETQRSRAPPRPGKSDLMTVFTAESTASSRHPQDWGRAVAVALNSLVAQSQNADTDLNTSELFGADLTLHIDELADGTRLTLT